MGSIRSIYEKDGESKEGKKEKEKGRNIFFSLRLILNDSIPLSPLTPHASSRHSRRQVLLLSETLREQRNGSRYNALNPRNALPREPPQRTASPTQWLPFNLFPSPIYITCILRL
jgi:hypothetical protein